MVYDTQLQALEHDKLHASEHDKSMQGAVHTLIYDLQPDKSMHALANVEKTTPSKQMPSTHQSKPLVDKVVAKASAKAVVQAPISKKMESAPPAAKAPAAHVEAKMPLKVAAPPLKALEQTAQVTTKDQQLEAEVSALKARLAKEEKEAAEAQHHTQQQLQQQQKQAPDPVAALQPTALAASPVLSMRSPLADFGKKSSPPLAVNLPPIPSIAVKPLASRADDAHTVPEKPKQAEVKPVAQAKQAEVPTHADNKTLRLHDGESLFDHLDRDGDGIMSREELEKAREQMHPTAKPEPPAVTSASVSEVTTPAPLAAKPASTEVPVTVAVVPQPQSINTAVSAVAPAEPTHATQLGNEVVSTSSVPAATIAPVDDAVDVGLVRPENAAGETEMEKVMSGETADTVSTADGESYASSTVVPSDGADTAETPVAVKTEVQSIGLVGTFLSFVGRMFGAKDDTSDGATSTEQQEPATAESTASNVSSLSSDEGDEHDEAKVNDAWSRQDIDGTAEEAQREQQLSLDIEDPWATNVQEDIAQEDHLRHEDRAMRVQAETAAKPQLDSTESELVRKQREGSHVSDFWATLANEDSDIQASLADESLDRYEALTKAQNIQVYQTTKQFKSAAARRASSTAPNLRRNDAPAIHDAWVVQEEADQSDVTKVKKDPNLQMMQLSRISRLRH